MFDIYIKDFNQNGRLITTETLVQSIPSQSQGDLKLLQPIVKCEMGNAESFNFNIEGGTKFYDSFNQMKTFMRVVYDGDTIFYGRVLTIENSFYGTRKLRLEGPLAFLNDTSIEGVKEESRPTVSTNTYLSTIINNHNAMCADSRRTFTLGEVPGNYRTTSAAQQIANNSRKYGQEGWQDSKGAIEDLRSHYGGYLRVRCPGHRSGNTFVDEGHYLDWMNHYFNQNENTQTIEVGKNVLDISTSTEIDNIFTVVIPIGNNKQTASETVDGEKKETGPKHFYVPGKEVTVPSICPVYGAALNSGYHTYDDYYYALEKYGRIVKTVTFDDADNESELLTKCREWIKNNYQGEVTKFTIKAIDMHQIGDASVSKIMVGDRVKIIYPVVKEDGTIEKRTIVRTCLSISYDLYNPENNAYTFGIPANILTKSYGVMKQGKSTTQASTTPKSSPSYTSEKTADWLDQVVAWLQEHKVCYRHKVNIVSTSGGTITLGMDNAHLDEQANANMPWKESLRSHEKGPYTGLFDHGNYFIDTQTAAFGEFVSARTMWKFISGKEESTFNQEELNKRIKDGTDAMVAAGAPSSSIEQVKASIREQYEREHPSTTTWTAYQVTIEGLPTSSHIFSYNIIEYVKQEYGIDLKNNFAGVKPPNNITYTDSNGTEVTLTLTGNEYRTKEFYSPNYSPTQEDKEHGYHQMVDADGNIIVSRLEDDGEWHYTQWDPTTGTEKEIHIRDLDLHVAQAADFLGTEITQGRTPMTLNADGTPYIYRFGQGTEKWADGEMAIAKVDGDVVTLGSKVSQYTSVVSQYINGSWIMPFEFYVDTAPDGTVTKKAKHGSITVGEAGTTQYIAYLSKKYTPPKYLPVPKGYLDNVWTDEQKAQWRQENMVDPREEAFTPFVGAGTWDTENLAIKGGIYTVHDDDGRPVTYVASKQLIMGDQNTRMTIRNTLVAAGLFEDSSGNVITNPDLVNWNDVNLDHAIYTPVLLAKSIYAEQITAYNARFKTIETDYAKINNLDSHISKIDVLHTKSISSDGNIAVTKEYGYMMAPYFYLGTPGNARDMASSLWTLKVAKNTDKYNIQKQAFNDDGWVDIPNTTIDVGNASKYIASNYIMAPYIYVGVEGNAYNLASKAISSASLVRSGNTYYLHFYNCDNDELEITKNNQMSFSRATSLSLAWSGGYGTVTASPQNETYKFRLATNTSKSYTFSTKWKQVVLDEYHVVGNSEYPEYEVCSVSIDCSDIYTSGWGAARSSVSGKTYTVSGVNYTYYYFPVSAVTSGYRQSYMKVAMPNSTVDGAKSDYTYHITSDNNDSYIRYGNASGPIVAQINHGKYNAGWNDARSRVVNNIPYSDIGEGTNSSISVLVPNTNGSSANSTYSYAMSLTSHTPPGGSAYKCVELKVNSSNVVSKLDINTDWNNRYNDGYNASHSMYGTEYVSTSNIYAQVTTRELGYDSSITIYPTFTTTTGGQQRGSGITISSKPDRYNTGYNAGWDAAVSKVEYPTSAGTGSSVTFKYPKTDGSSRIGDSKQYFLHDNSDGTVVLRYQSGSNSSGAVYTNVAQVSASSGGIKTGWEKYFAVWSASAYDNGLYDQEGVTSWNPGNGYVYWPDEQPSSYDKPSWGKSKVTASGDSSGGVTPSSISLHTSDSSGFLCESNWTALLYRIQKNSSDMNGIFNAAGNIKVQSGKYYAFRVDCSSASNSGRWYYFMT